MKKFAVLVVFFMITILGVYAEPIILSVKNLTGYDIYELYISSEFTDDWEEDVLGDNILEDRQSWDIILPFAGVWDIKWLNENLDTFIVYDEIVPPDGLNLILE
jgi:hypothetical protein